MKCGVTLQCGIGRGQSGLPPYFLVPRPTALHQRVQRYQIPSGAVRIVESAFPGFTVKDGWSLSSTFTPAPSKYLHEPCRSDWSSHTSPADVPAQREPDLNHYPTPYAEAQYSFFMPYGLMLNISRGTAPTLRLWWPAVCQIFTYIFSFVWCSFYPLPS